jgi:hypothetical protein
MQTFLPYRDFASSAHVLDNKRLGKQRVETLQIMKALVLNEGWINHPVTRMWRGYEFVLMSYQEVICDEWAINRGFNDTCLEKTQALFMQLPDERRLPKVPPWMGLKKFHSAHRANLLLKDPIHYGRFGWKEKPVKGYYYPEEGFQRRNA